MSRSELHWLSGWKDGAELDLSPASAGDTLIAVEISRNFDGDAVAAPLVLCFEEDRAIAA